MFYNLADAQGIWDAVNTRTSTSALDEWGRSRSSNIHRNPNTLSIYKLSIRTSTSPTLVVEASTYMREVDLLVDVVANLTVRNQGSGFDEYGPKGGTIVLGLSFIQNGLRSLRMVL
ncbi:unnamed protein product [Vicia faba]|uniref:Uncharacterized protein n=1 Tax=Vicia faba TaxID=3906 RepID=A0AAV0Z5Y3_VICFA|nr:unnamed protein product [Vicia faba]